MHGDPDLLLPRPLRQFARGLFASINRPGWVLRHNDLSAALARRRLHGAHSPLVGWILAHDQSCGATRVRALIPHRTLRSWGINSLVLRKSARRDESCDLPEEDIERLIRARLDVVVFERTHDETAVALASRLRTAGVRTVYAAGEPTVAAAAIAGAFDRYVGASPGVALHLAGEAPERAAVVEGAIDAPPGLVKRDFAGAPDGLRVAWVGYPENLHLLGPVRKALRHPQLRHWRLEVITRGPEATIPWHPRTYHRHLVDADIAVLPQRPDDPSAVETARGTRWYGSKPNTRMTMLKALGVPMVATPTAAYLDTLTPGVGCLYADSVEEWTSAFLELGREARRREIALAEREEVLRTYGAGAVAARWLRLFGEVTGRSWIGRRVRVPDAFWSDALSEPLAPVEIRAG